jgi:hypothetical protein
MYSTQPFGGGWVRATDLARGRCQTTPTSGAAMRAWFVRRLVSPTSTNAPRMRGSARPTGA